MNLTPVPHAILITDFDGTLTQQDFYQLVVERLLPPDAPDYWADYRAGRITHFEALRSYFAAAAPVGEARLSALLADMGLEPDLANQLAALRRQGWEVVVVSAGCSWYIDRLLTQAGVTLEVHANPGHIDGHGRLIVDWPTGSPFFSPQTGIDKSAVVRAAAQGGRTVAFAGDGPPDLEPALLVPGHLRFARAGSLLAASLAERAEPFHPFQRWSEVAQALRCMSEPGTPPLSGRNRRLP